MVIGEGYFKKACAWWDAASLMERVQMCKEVGYVHFEDLVEKQFEEIPWSTRHDLGPAVEDVLRKS